MDRVLLLNGDYRPLSTISAIDAVCLLMTEKAYGVVGTPVARKFKTVSTVFEVPYVIVLKRYVNVPHRTKKWSRRGVLERDNYTCIFCNRTIGEVGVKTSGETGVLLYRDFTIEHLKPVSRGGKSTWGNTACACYGCNHTKANRTPHEVGMKMLWEPKRPRTNYWVASGRVPVPWKQWLETS